jgi:hypothetical protein
MSEMDTDGGPDVDEMRKLWWLHDARWYQAVMARFGQDAANELNAQAMRFVARRVAIDHAAPCPGGAKEVAVELDKLLGVMFADMVKAETTVHDDTTMETVVTDHFALRMLRATRSLAGYRCPCLDLRGGWLEGMGVPVDDEVVECQRDGASVCRFRACLKPAIPGEA